MAVDIQMGTELSELRVNHPAGTLIVPCHDLARYHQFSHDLTILDVPDGTVISFQRSASIVQNLNEGVKAMLESDSQWAWFIADDHCFGRDVVVKLLEAKVDIVVPIVCRRGPPFSLVVFDEEVGDDEYGRTMFHTIQYDELPDVSEGLMEVVAAGSAGMLVQRHVFEKLGYPWFANSDGISCNEDVEFCKKARAAGFKIHADLNAKIGHMGAVAAWPAFRDGQWGIVFDFQGAGQNQIWMPGGVKLADKTVSTATGKVDW